MKSKMLVRFFELVIPILTFFFGYGLSNLDKYFENKDKVKNVKIIFYKELTENYKSINGCIPLEERKIIPEALAVEIVTKLSFSVYEKYLDRLDILKENEINSIFDSYLSLRKAVDVCNEFLTMRNENYNADIYAADVILINSLSKDLHKKLESSILLYNDGEEFINSLGKERGKTIKRFEEISKKIKEMKNEN